MLHAVIIDDEINGLRSLELLIEKFITDVKIVASTTNSLEGIDLINNYRPEIVFLDISMPILDGFGVLENLNFKKFSLIFTTAHREHALKAIKNNAFDYLLKPINISELQKSVERVKKQIISNIDSHNIQQLLFEQINTKKFRVLLPTKNGIEYVNSSEIVYIEADSHNCKISLDNSEIVQVTKPIKEYEVLLCKAASSFMRVHNSYIINLNYVSRYNRDDGGYAVMYGKKSIPISKFKKEDFLKYFDIT